MKTTTTKLTAAEFAATNENVIVWYFSTNNSGKWVALLNADDREGRVPFELNDLDGEVIDGQWEATTESIQKVKPTAFGADVRNVKLYSNREEWVDQVVDYATSEGVNEDTRDWCESYGITNEEFDALTWYVPN